MEEKIVSLNRPISNKELKKLKALKPEEQLYEFTYYMYNKRERLVGEVDLWELTYFLGNVKIDLNDISPHGEPLIFFAIESYAPAVLKFLLENGANINVKTKDGLTPLEYAEKNMQDCIKMGWKPDSNMVTCAKQCVELLKKTERIEP